MRHSHDRPRSLFNIRSKFKYKPLNKDRHEIRLLHLDPSTDIGISRTEESLRGELKHVSLLDDPAPSYYAISYCWGESPPLRRAVFDKKEGWVPESAVKALQSVCHPRYGRRDLPIWIDALCINQTDDEEKSHQVAMMGEIYASAKEVLIYLGEGDDTSASGFRALRAVLHAYDNGNPVREDFFTDVADWASLLAIFNSPYFNRLWPVQEILRSKCATVWRGKFSLGWEDVRKCANLSSQWLEENAYFHSYPGFGGLSKANLLPDLQTEKRDIRETLDICSYFSTTDLRDKVYAALGLMDLDALPEHHRALLQPDYSLSTRNVLIRATTAAIQTSQRLDILENAQHSDPQHRFAIPWAREKDLLNLPSWIPKYDTYGECPQPMSYAIFRADGGIAAEYYFPTDGVLETWGVAICDITHVNARIPFTTYQDLTTTYYLDTLGPCFERTWPLDNDIAGRAPTDLVRELAFTHFMHTSNSTTPDGFEDEIVADLLTFIRAYREHQNGLAHDILEGYFDTIPANSGDVERFVRRTVQSCRHRHLAKTSDGKYAMVPSFTRPGDTICILYGCPVPVVLRLKNAEHEITEQCWQLIGTVYVYGIMKGEHIETLVEGRLKRETRLFNLI